MVNNKCLPGLRELGIDMLCPNVGGLTLEFREAMVNVDAISMAASLFPRVTRLSLLGTRDRRVTVADVTELCKKLINSYAPITTLSFTDIGIGNKMAMDIIGYLRHHKCLTRLE